MTHGQKTSKYPIVVSYIKIGMRTAVNHSRVLLSSSV